MSTDAALTQYIDPDQLTADLTINPTNLSDALMKHAGLYAHYAIQAVRARRQYERWKSAFEVLEAQLDGEYRASLASEGKKPTEASIKASITQDSRWKACSGRVIDAQQVWKLGEVAERAFDQRKDTLLQMARDAAREAEGQLRVTLNGAGRDRLTDMLAAQRGAAAAA